MSWFSSPVKTLGKSEGFLFGGRDRIVAHTIIACGVVAVGTIAKQKTSDSVVRMDTKPATTTPSVMPPKANHKILLAVPTGYRDLSPVDLPSSSQMNGCPPEGKMLVAATLRSKNNRDSRLVMNASVPSDCGYPAIIQITIFGNTFAWKDIRVGDTVHLYGGFKVWNSVMQMNNPEIVPREMIGRVVPSYRGHRYGTVEKSRHLTQEAADQITRAIGLSQAEILRRSGVEDMNRVFVDLHFPDCIETAEKAQKAIRMLAALQIVARAEQMRPQPVERAFIDLSSVDVDGIIAGLPHALTDDQRLAVHEILADLQAAYPMSRLLSGDVGTGKTLTYLIPAYAAWLAGVNVAILTPNQLLVDQIAQEARSLFPGCDVAAITAETAKAKTSFFAPMLVGTTALLAAARKAGYLPDFLVVDEQHKLSRAQREGLCAPHTNILEATATAIPRTAALVTHGGMEVSVLKQSPVKKQIETRIVTREGRRELFAKLQSIIATGGQVAVVYPLVEGGVENDKRSVLSAAEMWQKHLPGKVGVIHGKMAAEEKHAQMSRMKLREFDVLVASTVIEIGVTVPALRAIVVVNSDRYGVSQLHQMRGRVARAGGDGYCFLYLPEEVSPDTMERLRLMEQFSDGFSLAERDLSLRGFGDLSADADVQTGKAVTVFEGVKLMPHDLGEVIA